MGMFGVDALAAYMLDSTNLGLGANAAEKMLAAPVNVRPGNRTGTLSGLIRTIGFGVDFLGFGKLVQKLGNVKLVNFDGFILFPHGTIAVITHFFHFGFV